MPPPGEAAAAPRRPDLREALLAMARADAETREDLMRNGELPPDAYHPRMREVHERNNATLAGLIAEHGWPGHRLVGQDGAQAAWLIAQHAVLDPALQARCAALLADAVAAGEAPMWQLAYLEDRVRMSQGRPQRFGTQMVLGQGGRSEPWDLEDPDGLDARRRAAGLPPLAEALARIRAEDARLAPSQRRVAVAPTEAPAARVPRQEGEAKRRWLRGLHLLRLDLRPIAEEGQLLLPLVEEAPHVLAPGVVEVVRATFAPQATPRPRYQDVAQVPEALRSLLPTSFDLVGDLVVVKLPEPLLPHAAAVGEALLASVGGAKGVLLDGGVQGVERVRRVTPVAGEARTTTEHVEYGARFHVDLAQAYFSPRLATEHHRVAALVGEGEVVLDLFAGVGPFAIHAARTGKPARVVAVDVNPAAAALAQRNAERNGVAPRVEVVCADAQAYGPSAEVAGACDRVVMNFPQGADAFWEAALAACKPGGATVHYHRILDHAEVARHLEDLVARAAAAGWEAREVARRVVRAYSPGSDHLAVDFAVRRAGPSP